MNCKNPSDFPYMKHKIPRPVYMVYDFMCLGVNYICSIVYIVILIAVLIIVRDVNKLVKTLFLFCSDYFTERITNSGLNLQNQGNGSYFLTLADGSTLDYRVDTSLFAVRTCQSYFQPQETIQYTNIGPFLEGMSAGATELEDFIITPDLRGEVCTRFTGPLKCLVH